VDDDLDAVLLHCLNHVSKSADLIKRNNERLKSGGSAAGEEGEGPPPRDQGFTRPKVLLLLPMRNLAFRAVRRLVALAQKETRADSVQVRSLQIIAAAACFNCSASLGWGSWGEGVLRPRYTRLHASRTGNLVESVAKFIQQGKERFLEQFAGDDDEEEQQQGGGGGKKDQGGASWQRKPAEHRALFGGNTDDHFRFGIKITRGQVKLFSDLLSSDIVVASPVAVATKLAEERAAAAASAAGRRGGGGGRGGGRGGRGRGGADGGRGERAERESGESDLLSSIEVLVVERADVMMMQNFDHVMTGENLSGWRSSWLLSGLLETAAPGRCD
jgi:U3 small nucleolar RNA-associated protein 25